MTPSEATKSTRTCSPQQRKSVGSRPMKSPPAAAKDEADTYQVYRWVTFGIPELLASDNGRDFVSRHMRETAIKAAISLQFTPVRTPTAKGTVERSFGSTNTRLFHQLGGTTLGKALSHLNYEASKHAELTLQQLRQLMEQYVVTIHNPAQRRGRWRSANDLFLEGIQRHPPRMPSAMSDLDALFALTEYRVVQQYGIQYRHLTYQCDELVKVFHSSERGTTLSISVDITDLRAVRVQHPVTGRYFVARCVRNLGDAPYPLERWLAHLGLMKEKGLTFGNDHDHALAERALQKAIARLSEAATVKARKGNLRAYKQLAQGVLDGEGSNQTRARNLTTAPQPEAISPTSDIEDTLLEAFSQSL